MIFQNVLILWNNISKSCRNIFFDFCIAEKLILIAIVFSNLYLSKWVSHSSLILPIFYAAHFFFVTREWILRILRYRSQWCRWYARNVCYSWLVEKFWTIYAHQPIMLETKKKKTQQVQTENLAFNTWTISASHHSPHSNRTFYTCYFFNLVDLIWSDINLQYATSMAHTKQWRHHSMNLNFTPLDWTIGISST